MSLPDWQDLPDAETALLDVLEAVNYPFDRMRQLRRGIKRLEQLLPQHKALKKFRSNYRWLQVYWQQYDQPGAADDFSAGVDDLIEDALTYGA